jgi:hypothetical protein
MYDFMFVVRMRTELILTFRESFYFTGFGRIRNVRSKAPTVTALSRF